MSASAEASRSAAASGLGLRVDECGVVPYREGLALQEAAIAAVRAGGEDRLLLLEHPPVVTLGRSSSRAHLLESEAALCARGISVESVARGGDVTYHGRGQLVGYLISNLRARGEADVHGYLRSLESAVMAALAELGARPCTVPGRTGVFIDSGCGPPTRKIASIGVGVRHWVTHHGFALNVDIDLAEFDVIVPCGLEDIEMTSLQREGLGAGPAFSERTRNAIARSFAARFGSAATCTSPGTMLA